MLRFARCEGTATGKNQEKPGARPCGRRGRCLRFTLRTHIYAGCAPSPCPRDCHRGERNGCITYAHAGTRAMAAGTPPWRARCACLPRRVLQRRPIRGCGRRTAPAGPGLVPAMLGRGLEAAQRKPPGRTRRARAQKISYFAEISLPSARTLGGGAALSEELR